MAKKKSEKPTETELKALYKEETGKNALHCGKLTKGYREWKSEKLG